MEQLDLRNQFKYLYAPSAKKVELVEVPCLHFIAIDGAIEPGHGPGTSPRFQEATEALYAAAYTLKFMIKQRKEDPVDYPVMPLEGLWWVEDGQFDITRKDNWFYTLMIMQPDLVTPDLFDAGLKQVRRKKGDQPAFSQLRLVPFQEGLCLQIMHIGPYATEPATVEKMHAFANENGYQLSNKHHEIYLGNPLRSDPAKLKTILRHPITK
jgi:hypothetical protein